jgi:predicted helicase
MRHLLAGANLALCTTRGIEIRAGWQHVWSTRLLIQLHSVSLKEVNHLFPLYLYPDGKLPEQDLFAHGNGRRPNLSAEFIADLRKKLGAVFVPEGLGRPGQREAGPELVFNYAYALFHSPGYRHRFAEFLRADFPRLPLTSDFALFQELAGLGGELVDLHARGQGDPRGLSFPVKGHNRIEAIRYQPAQGRESARVWINDQQYFEGVPEAAWVFPVGGYLPAQRWLKDRRGRMLGFQEQSEYQRLIWALLETRRLMAEIDARIAAHGGWPLK